MTLLPFPGMFSRRAISLILVFSLTLTTELGLPISAVAAEANDVDVQSMLNIPNDLGRIESFRLRRGKKTIIYIQDAHDSLEAQLNISKLIEHYVEKHQIQMVYEEGYEGEVPTDQYFQTIRDPHIRELVSFFLMDQLRIGGAEYLHINRTNDFQLLGADNIALHLSNVMQYRKAAVLRTNIHEELDYLESLLQPIADRDLPRDLRQWLKWKKQWAENAISMPEYLKRFGSLLKQYGPLDLEQKWPNLSLLMEGFTLESNDALIPEWDAWKLLKEIKAAEDKFVELLLPEMRSKELFHHLKILDTLKQLNQLRITPDAYEESRKFLGNFNGQELADFIARESGKPVVLSNYWETAIRQALRFYEVAHQRDSAIAEALNQFSQSSESAAVLVFGGFHKDAIVKIMESLDFSYVVITPTIQRFDERHHETYEHLMTRGFHAFEMPLAASLFASRPEILFEMQQDKIDILLRAFERLAVEHAGLDRESLFLQMARGAETEVRNILNDAQMPRTGKSAQKATANDSPASLRSESRSFLQPEIDLPRLDNNSFSDWVAILFQWFLEILRKIGLPLTDIVTRNGLVHHVFVQYNKSIERFLSEQLPKEEERVVVAGAIGPSMTDLFYTTKFTQAYALDIKHVRLHKLQEEFNYWSPLDSHRPYFRFKFARGYAPGWQRDYQEFYEFYIFQELQAMGVKKEDVEISEDQKGRPVLTFRMPRENKLRQVTFVQADLLDLTDDLKQELKGKADVYFEKGALDLPDSHASYLPQIVPWLKPGAIAVISPYGTMKHVSHVQGALGKDFQPINSREVSVKERAVETHTYQHSLYGWKLHLYRHRPFLPDSIREDVQATIRSFRNSIPADHPAYLTALLAESRADHGDMESSYHFLLITPEIYDNMKKEAKDRMRSLAASMTLYERDEKTYAARSESREMEESPVSEQAAFLWFDGKGNPVIHVRDEVFAQMGWQTGAEQIAHKLRNSLEKAFQLLSAEEQQSLFQFQKQNKIQRHTGEWMEIPLPIRIEQNVPEYAYWTPHEVVLNDRLLRGPPDEDRVLTMVLLHALRRSLHRFSPDQQAHESEVFQRTLAFVSQRPEYKQAWQNFSDEYPPQPFFGHSWYTSMPDADTLTGLDLLWGSIKEETATELQEALFQAMQKGASPEELRSIVESLLPHSGLPAPSLFFLESNPHATDETVNHFYIVYPLSFMNMKIIRLAPRKTLDVLASSDSSQSVLFDDLRIDIVRDSGAYALDVYEDRKRMQRYGPLYSDAFVILQESSKEQALAVQRLKDAVLQTEDRERSQIALELLYSLSKTAPQETLRKELNHFLFNRVTERPVDFPDLTFNYSPLDHSDFVLKFSSEGFESPVRVAYSVLGGKIQWSDELTADESGQLTWTLPQRHGWIQYAVQIKDPETGEWQYLSSPDTARPDSNIWNGLVKFQKYRGTFKMASIHPRIFNLKMQDMKPLVDEYGNVQQGSLEDLEAQLKDLKSKGYETLYLQVLESGAPGEAGPDSSAFSPLSQVRVSAQIGGMAGLLKLQDSAREIGLEIAIDMIPHASRSNRTAFPRTAVWILNARGELVRRAASDGGFTMDWFDGFSRNWADYRNFRDYSEQIAELARLGFSFRIDVGHVFDTTFEPHPDTIGLARLRGEVVSEATVEKTFEGESRRFFKTTDLRFTEEPNMVLAGIIYQAKKTAWENGHQIHFYGENWHGHEARLIQAGVDYPYDPVLVNFWDVFKRDKPSGEVTNTLRWQHALHQRFGGATLTGKNNHDVQGPPVEAFGDSVFAATAALIFSSDGAVLDHFHYAYADDSGNINWEKLYADIGNIPFNAFGPARVVNGQTWPSYDWVAKDQRVEKELARNHYFRDLNAHYERIHHLAQAYPENPIALDVGHNRVLGLARSNGDETLLMLAHMGSPYAADINFHPENSLQQGQGLGEFEDEAIYELLEVYNNAQPEITEEQPGDRILITGEAIRHLGLGPISPLPILGVKAFRFKKLFDQIPPQHSLDYRAMLRDSLRRYRRYGPHDRFEHSFIAREVVRALHDGYVPFKWLFDTLTDIVESNGVLDTSDLIKVFGDVVDYAPELRVPLLQHLVGIAVQDQELKPAASENAIKVLRNADVGEVVLTSPESLWSSGSGGLALYVTDLAKELASLGVPVTVIVPLFSDEKQQIFEKFNPQDTGRTIQVKFNADASEWQRIKIYETRKNGVRILYLENGTYFNKLKGKAGERSAYNGNSSERLRFVRMLSLGTLLTIREMNIHASVIHTNDWTTAYVKAYLEGRERIDSDAQNLNQDFHLKETRVLSTLHNFHRYYHGKVIEHHERTRVEMVRHDLGFDPARDWDILFNPGEWQSINPTFTAIKTADHVRTVSQGYHARTLMERYAEEFGQLTALLQWKNSLGVYDGEANGFALVERQRTLLAKLLFQDAEFRTILESRREQLSSNPEEENFVQFLDLALQDPSKIVRSFLELGHEEDRQLLARLFFDFIQPYQKQRLQRSFQLPENPDAFIYSMLHRIDEQKGHQLLLSDIWDRNNPGVLQAVDGLFEEMPLAFPLSEISGEAQSKLEAYARDHGRQRLRAVEVALILMPQSQFIIAGSVEKESFYDEGFRDIAARFPAQLKYRDSFIKSDSLDYELIYSGSTRFGMPSWFEPGGLSNLEAAGYGVPRHTTQRDGLNDGEIKLKDENGNVVFQEGFEPFNPASWLVSLQKHYELATAQPGLNRQLQYEAITQDNRWLRRAKNYIERYILMSGAKPIPELHALEVASAIHRSHMTQQKDPADELTRAGFQLEEAALILIQSLFVSDNSFLAEAIINDHLPDLKSIGTDMETYLITLLEQSIEQSTDEEIRPLLERALAQVRSESREDLEDTQSINNEPGDLSENHLRRPRKKSTAKRIKEDETYFQKLSKSLEVMSHGLRGVYYPSHHESWHFERSMVPVYPAFIRHSYRAQQLLDESNEDLQGVKALVIGARRAFEEMASHMDKKEREPAIELFAQTEYYVTLAAKKIVLAHQVSKFVREIEAIAATQPEIGLSEAFGKAFAKWIHEYPFLMQNPSLWHRFYRAVLLPQEDTNLKAAFSTFIEILEVDDLERLKKDHHAVSKKNTPRLYTWLHEVPKSHATLLGLEPHEKQAFVSALSMDFNVSTAELYKPGKIFQENRSESRGEPDYDGFRAMAETIRGRDVPLYFNHLRRVFDINDSPEMINKAAEILGALGFEFAGNSELGPMYRAFDDTSLAPQRSESRELAGQLEKEYSNHPQDLFEKWKQPVSMLVSAAELMSGMFANEEIEEFFILAQRHPDLRVIVYGDVGDTLHPVRLGLKKLKNVILTQESLDDAFLKYAIPDKRLVLQISKTIGEEAIRLETIWKDKVHSFQYGQRGDLAVALLYAETGEGVGLSSNANGFLSIDAGYWSDLAQGYLNSFVFSSAA